MNWRAACAACLVLLPALDATAATGRGITLSGFLGAGYLLSTDQNSSQSLFDLTAGLNLRGGLLDPGILRWGVGATYLGRWGLGQGTNAANYLGFDARVSALSRTPVSLTLGASRAYYDASSTRSGVVTSGNSVISSLSAAATVQVPGAPSFTADIVRTLVETEHPGADGSFAGQTRLGASVNQAFTAFDYGVAYNASWNDGTYAETNYRTDQVAARMSGTLVKGLKFNISDSYFLRLPTNQLPGNPRYDTNVLGTGLQWLPSARVIGALTYSHRQSLFAAPGQEPMETRGQQIQQTLSYQLLESLQIRESLSAEFARVAVGQATRSGWGESLGLGLAWNRPSRPLAMSATISGNVGLVQPDGGGLEYSYGGSASGSLTGSISRFSGTLGYTFSYGAGGAAVSGYTLQQTARAEGSIQPTGSSVLTALFVATSGRREDAFLGTFINRALTASLRFARAQLVVSLAGGLTDGVGAALAEPGFGAGLFLPVGYNTQSRFLNLTGTSDFADGRLGVRVAANIGDSTSPYRPTEVGAGFSGSVWYNIGMFRITVEDRLLFGGIGGGTAFGNTFMVRVSRDFAAEFFHQ